MALHGTWTGCLITENNVQASRSEAELSRFDSSWTWQIPSTCIRHASKINASFCAKFSPNGSFEMGCCCCFRSRWLLNTIYIGFSYKYTMCRELELPFRMQFEQRKINIFFCTIGDSIFARSLKSTATTTSKHLREQQQNKSIYGPWGSSHCAECSKVASQHPSSYIRVV